MIDQSSMQEFEEGYDDQSLDISATQQPMEVNHEYNGSCESLESDDTLQNPVIVTRNCVKKLYKKVIVFFMFLLCIICPQLRSNIKASACRSNVQYQV